MRDDSRILQELYRYADTSYLQTTTVTTSISMSTTRCVFSSSNVYQDPIHGQVFEFTTNTRVPCTLHQLDKCLWSNLPNVGLPQIAGHSYTKVSASHNLLNVTQPPAF